MKNVKNSFGIITSSVQNSLCSTPGSCSFIVQKFTEEFSSQNVISITKLIIIIDISMSQAIRYYVSTGNFLRPASTIRRIQHYACKQSLLSYLSYLSFPKNQERFGLRVARVARVASNLKRRTYGTACASNVSRVQLSYVHHIKL